MANGIYIATSGSVAQLRRMEVLSNNLANSGTSGFKADRVSFEQVQRQATGEDLEADPIREKHFVDVRPGGPSMDAGPLTRTDNPLDVAITGNGLLRVRTPAGERLTRDGRLMMGRDGTLRTQLGHTVLDSGGSAIRLPPDQVPSIREDGTITVRGRSSDVIAKLGVTAVDLNDDLQKDPEGLFIPPTDGAARPDATLSVQQGFVEESNVQPVRAMLELIEVQRTFSALRQVITASGEMDSSAVRLSNG